MMASCEATRAELVAFCKGEVSPSERAAIILHLRDCAPCREELASFEALFRLARSANRIEAAAKRTYVVTRAPTRSSSLPALHTRLRRAMNP